VFAGIIVIGSIACLAVKLLVWEPVDAYLIGAIGASTLWASTGSAADECSQPQKMQVGSVSISSSSSVTWELGPHSV
jgi:hypothetical protein